MKRFFTLIAAAILSVAAFAQNGSSQIITWTSSVEKAEGDVYKVIFTGTIEPGYHTYTLTDEFSATEIMDVEITGGELIGEPYEINTPKEVTDEFGEPAKHFYDEIILGQDIKVTGDKATYKGTEVSWLQKGKNLPPDRKNI